MQGGRPLTDVSKWPTLFPGLSSSHSTRDNEFDVHCTWLYKEQSLLKEDHIINQENPRWSGILLFPNHPRFCQLIKTLNCRYPRSSGMRWKGTNLENREGFYFPGTSQMSAMIGNHSRQIKTQICTVRNISVCQRWISLVTNPLNCWAPAPLSQIIWKISRISDILAKSGMVG